MRKITAVDVFGTILCVCCSIACFWAATSFLFDVTHDSAKQNMFLTVLFVIRIILLYTATGFMGMMSVAILKERP